MLTDLPEHYEFFFELLTVLVIIFSLIFGNSCANQRIANSTYTSSLNILHAIPNEIGGEDYVLLVQKTGLKRADRLFQRHLSKHFKGKVEEIYFPEIENQEGYKLKKNPPLGQTEYFIAVDPYFNGKLSNVQKYRFFLGIEYRVLIRKTEKLIPEEGKSPIETLTWYDFTFYILDRKTGKKYFCPEKSARFSPLFEGYIKAVEQVRKKGR